MQKKLITMAVAGALAAPAVALAQVEVYGTIHMSLNNVKWGEPNQVVAPGVSSVSKWDVMSHASNVGVRARESLGGGLSAWAQVETNASMERSNNVAHTSNFASRNSAVGLQGGWGNVFLGQWTTPWADLDALWAIGNVATFGPVTSIIGRRETTGSAPNPNCSNNGSGIASPVNPLLATNCDSVEASGGVGHPFWRRISNSIHYQSPVFSGLQIKAAYQTNQDKAVAPAGIAADPSMWSASVTWAGMGGNARIGVAFDSHKEFTSVSNSDSGWRLTGGYNFGFLDLGFAYEQMTYKTVGGDCDATQMGIAMAIPIGQGAIRASYSQADDIEGNYTGAATFTAGSCGAAGTGDNGAKQYNIGYDYRFSKRTTVGIGYAHIKNDPFAGFTWSGLSSQHSGGAFGLTITPGTDVTLLFTSMIHRF